MSLWPINIIMRVIYASSTCVCDPTTKDIPYCCSARVVVIRACVLTQFGAEMTTLRSWRPRPSMVSCGRCSNGDWTRVRRRLLCIRDDVIKWTHFPRYWPFAWGIHRSAVNSPHKGQWRGALMFSLICTWINGWVNNRKAGDLRRHRAHYDVRVMLLIRVVQDETITGEFIMMT